MVYLGCRVVQLLNHLNRKRPLWCVRPPLSLYVRNKKVYGSTPARRQHEHLLGQKPTHSAQCGADAHALTTSECESTNRSRTDPRTPSHTQFSIQCVRPCASGPACHHTSITIAWSPGGSWTDTPYEGGSEATFLLGLSRLHCAREALAGRLDGCGVAKSHQRRRK